jgi:hypothetical protein
MGRGRLPRLPRCGILAHGFARLRCDACAAERLVAFSCKGRGVCPSCSARRMVEVAAHHTDHVLPAVPVRQWVLSLPKRIRPFLPHDPRLAGDVLRALLRTIRTTLRRASPPASGRHPARRPLPAPESSVRARTCRVVAQDASGKRHWAL